MGRSVLAERLWPRRMPKRHLAPSTYLATGRTSRLSHTYGSSRTVWQGVIRSYVERLLAPQLGDSLHGVVLGLVGTKRRPHPRKSSLPIVQSFFCIKTLFSLLKHFQLFCAGASFSIVRSTNLSHTHSLASIDDDKIDLLEAALTERLLHLFSAQCIQHCRLRPRYVSHEKRIILEFNDPALQTSAEAIGNTKPCQRQVTNLNN